MSTPTTPPEPAIPCHECRDVFGCNAVARCRAWQATRALPPLPEPEFRGYTRAYGEEYAYTEEMMRTYALQAIEADRAARVPLDDDRIIDIWRPFRWTMTTP